MRRVNATGLAVKIQSTVSTSRKQNSNQKSWEARIFLTTEPLATKASMLEPSDCSTDRQNLWVQGRPDRLVCASQSTFSGFRLCHERKPRPQQFFFD